MWLEVSNSVFFPTLQFWCVPRKVVPLYLSLTTQWQGRTFESFEVLVKSIIYFDNIRTFCNIHCNVYIGIILNLASCFMNGIQRNREKGQAEHQCNSFLKGGTCLTCFFFNQPCLMPCSLGPWQFCLCYCFFLKIPGWWWPHGCPTLFLVGVGHLATSEATANPVLFILCSVGFLLRLTCVLTQSLTHYIGEFDSTLLPSL